MVRPSATSSFTRKRISSSVSGVTTTNGISTRQSVASVTCETRAKPSNRMLSRRDAGEAAQHLGAQRTRGGEFVLETIDRVARELEQPRHLDVAGAARLDFAQPPAHAGERFRAPLRPVDELVLEIGIALDRPDFAEHLVQHARGTA